MISCARCGCKEKPVYRANPKGENAVWKCESCLSEPIPDDLKSIVNDLQEGEK